MLFFFFFLSEGRTHFGHIRSTHSTYIYNMRIGLHILLLLFWGKFSKYKCHQEIIEDLTWHRLIMSLNGLDWWRCMPMSHETNNSRIIFIPCGQHTLLIWFGCKRWFWLCFSFFFLIKIKREINANWIRILFTHRSIQK